MNDTGTSGSICAETVPSLASVRSGLKKTAMKEGADTPTGHGASNMLELTEVLSKGVEGEQRRQVLASLERQQSRLAGLRQPPR
jgi:hypothetical protein